MGVEDMQADLVKVRQSYAEVTATQRRLLKQQEQAQAIVYKLDSDTTFKLFYAKLMNDNVLKLKGPSVSTDSEKALFMNSKALRSSYEENMAKKLSDLMTDGAILRITDPKVLGKGIAKIKVVFEKGAIYVPPKDK